MKALLRTRRRSRRQLATRPVRNSIPARHGTGRATRCPPTVDRRRDLRSRLLHDRPLQEINGGRPLDVQMGARQLVIPRLANGHPSDASQAGATGRPTGSHPCEHSRCGAGLRVWCGVRQHCVGLCGSQRQNGFPRRLPTRTGNARRAGRHLPWSARHARSATSRATSPRSRRWPSTVSAISRSTSAGEVLSNCEHIWSAAVSMMPTRRSLLIFTFRSSTVTTTSAANRSCSTRKTVGRFTPTCPPNRWPAATSTSCSR